MTISMRRILWAGLGAAALDAVYFSISALVQDLSLVHAFNLIARFWGSGLIRATGLPSALVGFVTHVGLAIVMAAAFAAVWPHLGRLRQRPITAGAGYGLVLFVVMYLGVLPARWPTLFPEWRGFASVLDILVHVAIGVLIAWVLTPRRDQLARR